MHDLGIIKDIDRSFAKEPRANRSVEESSTLCIYPAHSSPALTGLR